MENLWDMYGLDLAASQSGFGDGSRPDHSFGLVVYSLIYAHRAQKVLVLGYGASGYVPVLATAGQVATAREGLVVTLDPSPCDQGEYVRSHGYGREKHRFIHADLFASATEAVRFLGGLVDVLVVNLPYASKVLDVYHPLLSEAGIAVVRGGPVEIPGFHCLTVSTTVSLLTREKK